MEIIETLNNKIDKLIHDYDKLRLENLALQQELDVLKNENDELENEDISLGDSTNMSYMGTSVAYGRGLGVVIATGMD